MLIRFLMFLYLELAEDTVAENMAKLVTSDHCTDSEEYCYVTKCSYL